LTIPGANEDASATGDLDITDSVDIVGADSDTTIVDGNALDRVLHLIQGDHVSITGVTIQNGSVTGTGGGIYAPYFVEHLTITSSVIKGNSAIGKYPDGEGGGIYHNAPITSLDDPGLVIDKTVISNNTADQYTGGVLAYCASVLIVDSTIDGNITRQHNVCGGAVAQPCSQGKMRINRSTVSNNRAGGCAGINHSGQHLEVINSTISGNTSPGDGSAIRGSNVTVVNSTIANNVGSEGGALFGSFILANTIVAHNGPQNCTDHGTFITQGYNLASDFSCSLFRATDKQGVTPLLGSLIDNGGATLTHALLSGSPAIDAGNPSGTSGTPCRATDQRGVTRPVDGDSNGRPVCDIGAYEYLVPAVSIADTSVAEGDSATAPATAVFTATLSAAYVQDISVDYATANNTATSDSDYVSVTGTLVFAPGQTTRTINVQVIGDWLFEPDEDFFVHLSHPTRATISDGQGRAVIVNDDDPVCLPIVRNY
jgi:hypothetical protein